MSSKSKTPKRSKTTSSKDVSADTSVEDDKDVVQPTDENNDPVENVDEDASDVEEEVVKKEVTVESHIADYNELIALLTKEIDKKSREKEKGVKTLRLVKKRLVLMKKDVPQVIKHSRKVTKKSDGKKSGLMLKYSISKELTDFLGVPRDTKVSRVEATRAICVYAHLKEDETRPEMLRWEHLNPKGKRNLQNPHIHRAIVPDKVLSKLLRYEEYQRKVKSGEIFKLKKNKETGRKIKTVVVDDLLYYWVVQKLVNVHFK